MKLPIYLDYAATTPVDPRVAEVMCRYLTADGVFGNSGSTTHPFGRAAAQAVEQAREQVAVLVNVQPREIIWTAGATESNNLAIKGVARYYSKKGRHIVTSKTEHKAVLDTCRVLELEGYEVTYLDPEADGLIKLGDLEAALRKDTVLVSIMHVNNETGVIQDLQSIARLTRQRGILLHVDAAQSLGKEPIDLAVLDVDLMSFSAHKLYGPKGVGGLYVGSRPRVRLQPQMNGGGQERGLRGGTLATHQIVGMGEACSIAAEEMVAEAARVRHLKDHLWQGLAAIDGVYRNGHPRRTVAGILNVSFDFVAGESLLAALADIAVSSGSACSSASSEPSHVLKAMAVNGILADSAIRFSIGRFTTLAEIDHAIAVVKRALVRLRDLSPLWEMYREGRQLPAAEQNAH